MKIPERMRTMILDEPVDDAEGSVRALRLEERPLPVPKRGEVLVRVEASVCNPSDQMFLRGRYRCARKPPCGPGFEGAGVVVGSGGGMIGRFLLGKRVACGGNEPGGGTWAEYFVASVMLCFPLRKDVDFVAGATMLVNPLTALAFVDMAKQRRASAIVHTAAASQLGRLLAIFARERDLPVIHVVRREAQAELLRELGAEHVLNSSDDDHDEKLRLASERLGATLAFDAIAGTSPGKLLAALPHHSTVVSYGKLTGLSLSAVDPADLLFDGKQLIGFHLNRWLASAGLWWTLSAGRRIQAALASGRIATSVRCEVGFDGFADALVEYAADMGAGKVILRPGH